VVGEKLPARAAEITARYGVTVCDNASAVVGASIVVLVVKPQDVAAALDSVATACRAGSWSSPSRPASPRPTSSPLFQ